MQAKRRCHPIAAMILAVCPPWVTAQTTVSVNVNANADISLAGYGSYQLKKQAGSATVQWGTGALPAAIILPSGTTSVTFAITGGSLLNLGGTTCAAPCITLDFNGGNVTSDADGIGWPFSLSLQPHGAISGIQAPNGGFIAGVFEAGVKLSGSPPPSLNFNSSGLGTDFSSLSPELNQMFFIGDGLTGDGTGSVQTFFIPSGATLLYLGIPDQCESNGPTGCHADNSGVFIVTATMN